MTRADIALRCADCHSDRYTQLHFERMARLETLAARATTGSAPATGQADARVASLVRLAQHDYVAAERTLAQLVDALASER